MERDMTEHLSFEDFVKQCRATIVDINTPLNCAFSLSHLFDDSEEGKVIYIPNEYINGLMSETIPYIKKVQDKEKESGIFASFSMRIENEYNNKSKKEEIWSSKDERCRVEVQKIYDPNIINFTKRYIDIKGLENCYLIFKGFYELGDFTCGTFLSNPNGTPCTVAVGNKILDIITPSSSHLSNKGDIIDFLSENICNIMYFNILTQVTKWGELSQKRILNFFDSYYKEFVGITPFDNDPMFDVEELDNNHANKLLRIL